MSKKSFQIVMEEEAQAQLKARAKTYGVTIGDFIEQLLTSFEIRMKTAYSIMEFRENDFPYANGIIFHVIKGGTLQEDMTEKNKQALIAKGKILVDQAKLEGWEPKPIPPEEDVFYITGQDK